MVNDFAVKSGTFTGLPKAALNKAILISLFVILVPFDNKAKLTPPSLKYPYTEEKASIPPVCPCPFLSAYGNSNKPKPTRSLKVSISVKLFAEINFPVNKAFANKQISLAVEIILPAENGTDISVSGEVSQIPEKINERPSFLAGSIFEPTDVSFKDKGAIIFCWIRSA